MDTFTDILMAILVALIIVVAIQYQEVKSLKADVAIYQQQILMLKLDSERQTENTEIAYESAKKQIEQVNKKTKAILRTKVSSNCDASIKWLIQQAHTL